jgi:alkanesulfonate monooxygenase SsuD/methylene tetrahydromethanopterin reductase-like flavin-dependent oxidoreductase (luciferase family)
VSGIWRLEGGRYRLAAVDYGTLYPAYNETQRQALISPGPGTLVGRAAMNRQVVQIEDAWTDPLGVSPGWQQEEFAIVGLDYSRRLGRFTEAVDLIRRLYTEDQVTFDGKHFRTSKATLALKPMQKPRPRMWFGGSVEAAVKRVASIAETELGDTWVASSHPKTDVIVQQASVFKAKLTELGKPLPGDFPVLRNVVIAPDRATAIREIGPAIAESYKIFGNWGLFTDVIGDNRSHPEFDDLINGRFIIGSPDEVAEQIAIIMKATGGTRLVCRGQWVGMEQQHVMRTIELLGTAVAPLVRKALA